MQGQGKTTSSPSQPEKHFGCPTYFKDRQGVSVRAEMHMQPFENPDVICTVYMCKRGHVNGSKWANWSYKSYKNALRNH